MLISRAVTVKSRVTPNLRAQLAAETQKTMREIDSEVANVATDQERAGLIARREDLVRQLKEIAKLADGAEIVRGQVQGLWDLRAGDIWPEVLSSEIVVEDGRVVAIREGRAVSVAVEPTAGGQSK